MARTVGLSPEDLSEMVMPVIEDPSYARSPAEQLAGDPRWALVQRIVASKTFGKARRLSKFLAYVAERQLLNRTDEITEQQVGVHVFGRSGSYNPGEDNIVRTSARLLRQRLDQYFYEEGLDEPLRITIPRGGYVPVFEERPVPADPVATVAEEPAVSLPSTETGTEQTAPTHRRSWRLFLAIALAVLLAAAGFTAWAWRSKLNPEPSDRFWSTIFRPEQHTIFVPGDSGLVMFENLTHHASDLTTYSSGQYLDWAAQSTDTTPERVKNLGLRRYTAITDVQLAARLAAVSAARASSPRIRYARDITSEDFKTGNVILSGDPQGNPWVELFEPRLNFRFTMDPTSAIHIVKNNAPRPGEAAEYRSFGTDPEHHAYALIALTRNLSGNGYVMLIEGTTMAGLDAASDFLFSSADFSAAIRPSLRRDGSFADFEILLETQNIAARSSGFKVIAKRYANP